MWSRRSAAICSFVLCCSALLCLSGCGKKAKATVNGKVRFNQNPLTAGTVTFIDADGHSGSGTIKSDGSYTVTDAPVGEATITVFTPPPSVAAQGQRMPAHKGMPKEFLPPGQDQGRAVPTVSVPEKYQKKESSPLKFTVTPGSQNHDIDLTP